MWEIRDKARLYDNKKSAPFQDALFVNNQSVRNYFFAFFTFFAFFAGFALAAGLLMIAA